MATLIGNAANNIISGTSLNDYIFTEAGNDILYGYGGNDVLYGGLGNDILVGGTGSDIMIGGEGNDTYYVDSMADVVTEVSSAHGYDTVSATLTWTLGNHLERLILQGTAAISGTGNALANTLVGNSANNILSGLDGGDSLSGADGNDTLYGGNGNDVLNGGKGNDTMLGGAGNDTYYVDSSADVTTETSAAHGYDTVATTVTRTLGANLERLILTGTALINGTGNALDNTLTGNGAANILNGEGGNDTLNGGAGVDTMLGGTGNDVYYVDNPGDLTTETSTLATEIDTVVSTVSRVLGVNLERLILTGTAAINGTGNALANTIVGNSANSILSGLDGNDTLSGSGGNDTLNGGNGNDILDGGTGNDTMYGGAGDDSYYVDSETDVVTETSSTAGDDRVYANVTWTLGNYLERLILHGTAAIEGYGNTLDNRLSGNNANNVLSGDDGNDVLYGWGGNDTLKGGKGNDYMDGGDGDDIYYVDSAGDVTKEVFPWEGDDTVATTVTWTLGNYFEQLILEGADPITGTGNALANSIIGNFASNNLYGLGGDDSLYGLDGNDILDGGAGNDNMFGGAGDDLYYVDSASDVITETSLAYGNDTVRASVTWTLGNYLEALVLQGTAAIDGYGNALDNAITGNSTDNVINGFDGDDSLFGSSGNDTLDGGNGSDFIVGGNDNDTLNGGGGNDYIDGGTGNDILDGGAGNDFMRGEAGDDSYHVDSTTDMTYEVSAADGYDTVCATVTWTLGEHLEELILEGSAAINGAGNALANHILGNAVNNVIAGNDGNDYLEGLGGNDILNGGNGPDILVGGAGADGYLFDTALSGTANVDILADFHYSDGDHFLLDKDIFTRLTYTGVLLAENFASNNVGNAVDSNDYILYSTTNKTLYYDADGNGTGVKVAFAALSGTSETDLLNIDFTVVA